MEATLAPAWRDSADCLTIRGGPAPVVVERTFAWLGRCGRLSKDYEYLTTTSEAVIYLAMTRPLLRHLTPPMSPFQTPSSGRPEVLLVTPG
jgi:hypothetical protein